MLLGPHMGREAPPCTNTTCTALFAIKMNHYLTSLCSFVKKLIPSLAAYPFLA